MNLPGLASVPGSISAGLRGAVLLARARPEGVERFSNDPATVIRSFWALPLCLPSLICMKMLAWADTGIPVNGPASFVRYLLLFSVGWLLFVVVSHYLASTINKQDNWPRFVAVWSYCSVIENTLIALGELPKVLSAPAILTQAAQLVTIGWALWLGWYGIRLSLDTGKLTAAIFLAVDLTIGIVMAVFAGGT